VRQLNLNAVSAAEGQVKQSAFSRRIACASDQGFYAYYTGMPVPYIDFAAPTEDDLNKAISALRQINASCRKQAPAF